MAAEVANNIAILGYVITFGLGLVGHTCSLLTFCQRELRTTSTTVLFLGTTVSDLLYLFMSLYDFFLINLGIPQLSPHYDVLCRFRTFVMNFAQTTSAWLLVCVGLDRLVRARLPHRTRKWCTKKNVGLAQVIVICCSVTLNCHVLLPAFTTRFGMTRFVCGVTRDVLNQYIVFFFYAWTTIQVTMNILLPTLIMLICMCGIHRGVISAAMVRNNQQVQKQMLILMFSKAMLFLFSTLPYGLSRMVLTLGVDPTETEQNPTFIMMTALLNILLNTNYSLAFYIHCLTSTLFRQIFINTIKYYCCCRATQKNLIQPTVIATTSARLTNS